MAIALKKISLRSFLYAAKFLILNPFFLIKNISIIVTPCRFSNTPIVVKMILWQLYRYFSLQTVSLGLLTLNTDTSYYLNLLSRIDTFICCSTDLEIQWFVKPEDNIVLWNVVRDFSSFHSQLWANVNGAASLTQH